MILYAVVLGIIVVTLLGVSLARLGAVKTKADYLVAGRSLPAFVLVFTLLSSWIGSGSLLGGAENAYKHGFAALWQGGGGWAGLALIYFIAPRARKFAQFTIPDLLEALQPDRARAGRNRCAVHVHGDHQLPVHRWRRHSAPDLSAGDGDGGTVHSGGVRDCVYGDCGDGLSRLYGCGDRAAGDGDDDRLAAGAGAPGGRMERRSCRAAGDAL
jgi:hypothetical protein